MSTERWTIERGDDPLAATAIHAGHGLRAEVADALKLADADQLREEDPFTDRWVGVAANSIVVDISRFEVDLNRAPEGAVYRLPEDAWGLDLWKSPPADDLVERSRALYERFYTSLGEMCDDLAARHDRFVVFDLHSYNHRRGGPDAQADDPELNPEVNLGTGNLDHRRWGHVVDALMRSVREAPFDGGHLDIRENVRFKGGQMSRWINDRYGDKGCSLAIEVKKVYMDEWSGEPSESAIVAINEVLVVAADAVRSELA